MSDGDEVQYAGRITLFTLRWENPMQSIRLLAVICGHLAFAGATWATWFMGQKYAPELMASEVMMYPLIIGVVGIWIWFGFWSASVLRGRKPDGEH